MKTTLFEAAESIRILNQLSEQILPGKLALKIYDNTDVLLNKSKFLDQEIRKIVTDCHAVALDPENNDSRMVVKNEDGSVDEEKTSEFVNRVVEIRKTEADLDIRPFTEDDLELIKISSVGLAQIRWMIDRDT